MKQPKERGNERGHVGDTPPPPRADSGPTLSDVERRVLEAVYRFTRPTFDQLHRLAFPTFGKSTLYEKLEHLQRLNLIESRPLRQASRYYVLKTAGARLLGVGKLSGQYTRRRVDAQFHLAHSIDAELEVMADGAGWEVATTDALARRAIGHYVLEITQAERGITYPWHQIAGSLPRQVLPDRAISTPREVFVCIIAHPYAEMGFWSRRLQRYRGIIHELRFVFIALTHAQRLALQQAFVRNEARPQTRLGISVPPREACLPASEGVVAKGNFLILLPWQVDELAHYF